MNERIRELLKQATQTTNHYGFDQTCVDQEKFAQLIVRECVIRAEREWIRNGLDTEHNKAITGVIKSIKEHFGVE